MQVRGALRSTAAHSDQIVGRALRVRSSQGSVFERMRSYARSPASRRIGLGLADQALSSLTNFVLVLLVARAVDPREFGSFALVLVTYQLVLVMSRSIATDPLILRQHPEDVDTQSELTARAVGAAVMVGLATGSLGVVVGSALGGTFGTSLVALGATMPGLLLQDAWRFGFSAAGRPERAVVNDLAWGVAQLALVAWLTVALDAQVWQLVLAWGLAGVAAGLLGIAQSKIRPAMASGVDWLRRNSDVSSAYIRESIAATGGLALAFYIVSLVAGLATVGALRGAQLLYGPITVLYLAVNLSATPEVKRIQVHQPDNFQHAVHVLAATLAILATTWAVVLVWLPDALGVQILGPTWQSAEQVVGILAVAVVAEGFGAAYAAGLRVAAREKRAMAVRVVSAAVAVIAVPIGALVADARGAAAGLAAAYVVLAVSAGWMFRANIAQGAHDDNTGPDR